MAADYRYYDETIRAQAEIIATLLAASAQNHNDAKMAITALDDLRIKLARDVSAMSENVRSTITNSADGTAKRAAKLLQEQFSQADAAADAAAQRYLSAGRWLGVKTFLTLLTCLAAAVLGAWLLASPLLPTFEELQARRDEIVALTARAEDMEKKGANLEWTYCENRNGRKSLCFRTDGEQYSNKKNGAFYSVPYRTNR
jgi:hypothetical protein